MRYADSVNLTPEDWGANARRELSRAQIGILQQRRLRFLAGTVGLGGLAAAGFLVLALKLRVSGFADRGELFFWIPIYLFWVWLLWHSPARLLQVQADLRHGKVAQVEGRVICRWANTFGLIQFPKFELQVAGQRFSISRDEYFQFIHQGHYRILYSPQARVFLGAQPLSNLGAPLAAEDFQTGQLPELPDPLTERELEILSLLAAGLSNKEVAGQLSLSINTVKMYTSQIYRKMGVSRRTEAIALARTWGIL